MNTAFGTEHRQAPGPAARTRSRRSCKPREPYPVRGARARGRAAAEQSPRRGAGPHPQEELLGVRPGVQRGVGGPAGHAEGHLALHAAAAGDAGGPGRRTMAVAAPEAASERRRLTAQGSLPRAPALAEFRRDLSKDGAGLGRAARVWLLDRGGPGRGRGGEWGDGADPRRRVRGGAPCAGGWAADRGEAGRLGTRSITGGLPRTPGTSPGPQPPAPIRTACVLLETLWCACSASELLGSDPPGGGIGGDTAAILLGLKLYNSFPFAPVYNVYGWKPSSHQPGWLEQM